MATVVTRNNKVYVKYYYRDRQGNTQQKWETCANRKEAEERKLIIEAEQLKGTFLAPDPTTVRELFETWIPIQASKKKWTPRTYENTTSIFNNLINPYIGDIQLQQLRTLDIDNLYKTLAKTPCCLYKRGVKQKLTPRQRQRLLAGTTIHEVHTLLRTVLGYAVEWEIINKSPLPHDAPAKDGEEREIWSSEMVAAALDEIEDPALHLSVHLSFIGSMRQGEVLGLMPEDLDFEGADGRGTISISRALQRVSKEALEKTDPKCVQRIFPNKLEHSQSVLILKVPKTKKSRRILFMTEPLKQELKQWLKHLEEDEARDSEHYRNSGMLFRQANGDPIEQTLMRKRFEDWEKDHPQYKHIVLHGLRHSSATYQLEMSCGDIKAVQGNTGHAQASILMDTYAHMQDKSRLELAQKMEKDFYKQSGKAPSLSGADSKISRLSIDGLLEILKDADPESKRELARVLFA